MASTVLILDTHALVWYLADSPRLSAPAKSAIENIERGEAVGIVPTIVLAEIIHLADNRKIPLSVNETIARLQRSSNFEIASLDLPTVMLMIALKSYEIHDRVIVATAKAFGAALVTKDEGIHNSGAVPCIW